MSETDIFKRQRRNLLARLRSNFLTGLVVIAPIALTAWLIWKIIGWIDDIVLPFVPTALRPDQYVGINLKGIGVIIFLIFLILVGWVAKGLIGRTFLDWGEQLVDRTPVVRSIYNGLKQVAETVLNSSDNKFDKVCLVEFPSKGTWALGFISASAAPAVQEALNEHGEMTMVFVPLTPNPTSCFLLVVPKSAVIELDMSIEDGAKLIISAGMVLPPDKMVPQAQPLRTADSTFGSV